MKKPRLPGSTGASRAAKCDGNERLRKRIVAHSALADPNASHLEVAASVTLKRVKLPSGVQWLNAEQAHFAVAFLAAKQRFDLEIVFGFFCQRPGPPAACKSG
jgi:hypothetical protein